MVLDAIRTRRVTAVGAATAIVIGLVAITPAAGFVSPISALAIGAIGAVPSYFAIVWRARTRLDDSLDVLAGHGVGGMTGALLTGVFAEAKWGGTDGLLFGHPAQLGLQAIGVLATVAYSGIATFVVLKFVSLFISLRVSVRSEGVGLDVTQHGEEAYTNGEGAVLVLHDEVHSALTDRVRAATRGAA
jgi:Amt family ammonium transporter